jgi:hypothetical protein
LVDVWVPEVVCVLDLALLPACVDTVAVQLDSKDQVRKVVIVPTE